MKWVRSNGGGEYVGQKFQNSLEQRGVSLGTAPILAGIGWVCLETHQVSYGNGTDSTDGDIKRQANYVGRGC